MRREKPKLKLNEPRVCLEQYIECKGFSVLKSTPITQNRSAVPGGTREQIPLCSINRLSWPISEQPHKLSAGNLLEIMRSAIVYDGYNLSRGCREEETNIPIVLQLIFLLLSTLHISGVIILAFSHHWPLSFPFDTHCLEYLLVYIDFVSFLGATVGCIGKF